MLEKCQAWIHETEQSLDFVIAVAPGSQTVSEHQETSAEQSVLEIHVYLQYCVRSYYRADQGCRGNDCRLDSEVSVRKVAVEVLETHSLLEVEWYQVVAALAVVVFGLA